MLQCYAACTDGRYAPYAVLVDGRASEVFAAREEAPPELIGYYIQHGKVSGVLWLCRRQGYGIERQPPQGVKQGKGRGVRQSWFVSCDFTDGRVL